MSVGEAERDVAELEALGGLSRSKCSDTAPCRS